MMNYRKTKPDLSAGGGYEIVHQLPKKPSIQILKQLDAPDPDEQEVENMVIAMRRALSLRLWSDSDRDQLMRHLLKSALTGEQKEALLEYSKNIGQRVIDRDLETGKKQRTQIEAVAANAHKLLSSLNMLGKPARTAFHVFSDKWVPGASPIELDHHIKIALMQPDGNLLSTAWDWVAALESASTYVAGQFKIDKTSKPEEMRGRWYVSKLAERVRELTGSLPPEGRASWFAGFTQCLGQHLQLPMGPRIVKAGIKAAR